MNKENEKELDLADEEFEEPEPVLDDSGEDTTDWKTEASKGYGIASRFKTKFGKLKEIFEDYKKVHPEESEKPEEQKSQDKKQDFDLAEKSYLLANGVKKNQISSYWEEHQKTGLGIEELMNSPYFQEKLEQKATAEATPEGEAKRSGGAARDQADYWMQKGELPPNTPENQELRRKVAKARAQQEETGSKFSPRPIESSGETR